MIRITGGTFKGRNLQTVKGLKTRPTASRIRGSIFDVLAHSQGGPPTLTGLQVLDLFAGSGSMGFEALSRGAKGATFVDSSRAAARRIRSNASMLGVTERCLVMSCKVSRALRELKSSRDRFDLVFMDPPYFAEEPRDQALTFLGRKEVLKPGGVVVVEGPADKERQTNQWGGGNIGSLQEISTRRWGDTEVRFFRHE